MFHGVSLVSTEVERELKALPEVKKVNRLLGRQVAVEINGKETVTYLIGYDTVIRKINEEMTGVQAMSKQEFARINRKMIDESFLPIIFVLLLVSFAVGVTVIGLTIYTATVEKSREYGVLKAVGATNWQLYRIIFEQAFTSGVLGYIAGTALT